VLAGLAAWLPQELVDAATAAAAAAAAAGAGDEGAEGVSGSTARQEGDAAAVGSGGSGVSLWREEARVAGSVVELVTELEERWGGVLDQLEQAQVGQTVWVLDLGLGLKGSTVHPELGWAAGAVRDAAGVFEETG
jgi:hypothetical protein